MTKDQQTEPHQPQLYLVTPVGAQAGSFGPLLTGILARLPVACIRIRGEGDEDSLGRMADLVREIAHARDIAVVIDDHIVLAQRHGLDGVHLTDGARKVRYARKELGADAIIGAGCGLSRHEGLNAAEAGADYVAFAPAGATALGGGESVPHETFAWWSEMIEVPVVAEGALDGAAIEALSGAVDFFAIGPEIWAQPDPLDALGRLWNQTG
ncbi:MAG: thiamine phosphate synthase [Paracoccus sp. (in: a-proteobacteria)]|nr:thiamine phosphate synthase [Paracoccus sp. (in: a-proteobacteria)]